MRIFKTSNLYFVILLLVVSLPYSALCADQQKQERQMSAEEQKEIEIWQKMSSPGEKHKHLQYFVGEWESVHKMFAEPGKEPEIRAQEIHVRSVYGGRFTEANIKFKQKVFGLLVEGTVITGYDNYRERFFSVTYGNTGSEFYLMYGNLDATGKIRIDYGEVEDYMTKKKVKVKGITTIINNDKYIYEYYHVDPQGKEVKDMEIVYHRKKGE